MRSGPWQPAGSTAADTPDLLVVSTLRGTPLQPANWNHRVWAPALRKAKLDTLGYRWHDLRHTCISRLVAQGADVAVVQAVARHANAAVTVGVYTHLRDRRVVEAAKQFDPVRGAL